MAIAVARDARSALLRAVDRLEGLQPGSFGPALRTERTVVFNSRLFQLLLEKYEHEGLTFYEIRRREPRLFHELLGSYIGDVKTKDRVYKLGLEGRAINGVVLEAWTLVPEISAARFQRRMSELMRLLQQHGQVTHVPLHYADYIEATLNRFANGHPNNFRHTRYHESIVLNGGAELGRRSKGTFTLHDYLLFGIGSAGGPPSNSRKIPNRLADYRGSFLITIVRARSEHVPGLVELVRECLEVLLRSKA